MSNTTQHNKTKNKQTNKQTNKQDTHKHTNTHTHTQIRTQKREKEGNNTESSVILKGRPCSHNYPALTGARGFGPTCRPRMGLQMFRDSKCVCMALGPPECHAWGLPGSFNAGLSTCWENTLPPHACSAEPGIGPRGPSQ